MKNAVRMLGLVCAVMMLAGLVVAQEPAKVAGKWEMSYTMAPPPGKEGEPRTITQTLNFEQDGENLKGTIVSQRGEAPFTGTIKGKDLKFTVTRETPRGTMTTEYTGKVDGDAIKGTFTGFGGATIEWTAKRAK
jgi:hypothetical protein